MQLRVDDAHSRVASAGRRGIFFAVCGGMCFAMWPCASSLVEGQSQLGDILHSATLDPAAFFLLYAFGALICSLIILPPLCRHPIHNGPPTFFCSAYCALPWRKHLCGLIGGFMHGLGTILSLSAGNVLGNSVSISITRCQPLVVALWGVFLWGELQGATRATWCYFVCMMLLFVAAVVSFLFAGLTNS